MKSVEADEGVDEDELEDLVRNSFLSNAVNR